MKSTKEQLRKRGMLEARDIALLQNKNYESLISLLDSKIPTERSAAAHMLGRLYRIGPKAITALLERLMIEEGLYTRLEICSVLERGDETAAALMLDYLGRVGSNLYRKIPKSSSKKMSYPLPRDLVSRTLGKMYPDVFPIMADALFALDTAKKRELIDAVGFMIFYNDRLVTDENFKMILKFMEENKEDQVIYWKGITCLSSFPTEESKEVLEDILGHTEVEGYEREAKRSLTIIQKVNISLNSQMD